MATPLTGRNCSVRLSTDWTIIDNLGHWEITIANDELDASVFGTVWKANMIGMQGWSGTVEGFFDTSTATNKQIAGLMDASLKATKIQDIRFHLSTGLFWMPNFTTLIISTGDGDSTACDQGAYISNIRVTADKNALISASFNVVGYGALGLFTSTAAMVIETS